MGAIKNDRGKSDLSHISLELVELVAQVRMFDDDESGLSHLGHAVCSLEHAIYDMTHHPENDDREDPDAIIFDDIHRT